MPIRAIRGAIQVDGNDRDAIIEGARELLENPKTYQAMARVHNPYGDGRDSERISGLIRSFLRENTLEKTAKT